MPREAAAGATGTGATRTTSTARAGPHPVAPQRERAG